MSQKNVPYSTLSRAEMSEIPEDIERDVNLILGKHKTYNKNSKMFSFRI